MVNRLTHGRVLSHDLSVSGTDAGPPDQKRGAETMTTLADVAAAAGVSKAAASLVLSGKFEGRVSERKAERVRMAADELGYVRDAIAGGMRNGRTRTIGVIGERVLSTPYAVSMIDAVLSTSQSLGWSVLLTDAGHDGVAAKEAAREMVARRVGQVVIASMYHRVVPVPEQIKDVVVLNGVADRPGVPGVVPDERQGASDAVAHLVDLGHRRIGYLGHDDAESIAVRERSDSYRHSLREAGLAVDESLLVTGGLDPDSVDATARRLLDRPDRPTAVFCYNDALAAGVFRQAVRLGISIPNDLSVIGFDDLALISTNLDPRLTTMRLPHWEMAEWLTRELAAGRTAELPDVTRFSCPLIERASTAPPTTSLP